MFVVNLHANFCVTLLLIFFSFQEPKEKTANLVKPSINSLFIDPCFIN